MVDVKAIHLDREIFKYMIIGGTEGLWNVMGPNTLKSLVVKSFYDPTDIYYDDSLNSEGLCDLINQNAQSLWNEVCILSIIDF